MPKMLSQCPVCDGALKISEVECVSCGTQVKSKFDTCKFCRLSSEQFAFVELFMRFGGNLTRVGEYLSISYPTVRSRLDAVLASLGLQDIAEEPPVSTSANTGSFTVSNSTSGVTLSYSNGGNEEDQSKVQSRRAVLEMLASGEMTAEEAAIALKNLH